VALVLQKFSDPQNALFILLILSCLIGGIIVFFIYFKRVQKLTIDNAKLNLQLSLEKQNNEQFDQLLDQTHLHMTNSFNQLSNEALNKNNESFLKLAEENLKRYQSEVKSELNTKEYAIEQLIKPINDALLKTNQQINEIEKDRKESYGSLSATIIQMSQGQQSLQQETQNLVQALRRPEVRGQWGEMTLKRLAELSGMVENCDFFKQTHTRTETGAIRPDMIVRLPNNRDIIVDAKTPLDAYLSALQTTDEVIKQRELKRHAQIIRQRIKELAAKNYWTAFSQSPEFVVLFIPGEHFLSAALEFDSRLLEEAIQQNIILATPTNFIALLKTISYGWKQQTLADNAIEIRELGETLYKRLSVFSNHFNTLGKNLNNSVDSFNKTVGSLERQVLPSGKRFLDMGIRSKNEITQISEIETQARTVKQDIE